MRKIVMMFPFLLVVMAFAVMATPVVNMAFAFSISPPLLSSIVRAFNQKTMIIRNRRSQAKSLIEESKHLRGGQSSQ